MPLTWIDWTAIAGYLLINLAIGLYYRRRASRSTEDFFISGREVSWWLAGTSMVATTFAADTPLLVSGLVATNGIAGNWLWWSLCLSGMMTVFFFARYWRRAEILTDVELTELRYGGRPAAFLRGFRALYLGIMMNVLVLGWVTKAMVDIIVVLLGDAIAQGKILTVAIGGHALARYTLGPPAETALLICVLILIPFTGLYTFIGGLWGVLVTDLFQFILKMAMIVVLAWVAVVKIGGMQALKLRLAIVGTGIRQAGHATGPLLAFLPSFRMGWASDAVWTLPVITLALYLGVQWWASWYPGAEPGGGGYIAQRMFSAKDEKNSLGATLWFNIAHYALRPWPWIITGLVAIAVYSPHGGLAPSAAFAAQPEQGYVMVLRDFLPPALRGVMIAAFLAAYMSTIGTQLNWGTSYIINDFYRRFLRRRASERHYVIASQVAIVGLVVLTGFATAHITSIASAWELALGLGAGTGGVYLLRWYWWRINAWSEITAMIGAFVVTLYLHPEWLPGAVRSLIPAALRVHVTGSDSVVFATTALITAGVTTVFWIVATLATRPEEDAKLIAFYRRVRPSVWGWQRIAAHAPEIKPIRDLGANTIDWILGCALVYGALFGIGKLVLEQWLAGAMLCSVSAASGWLIYWHFSRRGWQTLSGAELPRAATNA